MANIPVEQGLILAGILLSLGLIGVIVRRNFFYVLLSIEIMLNAAGLAFIVASAYLGNLDGQVLFLFILAVAAAEVSVGLAVVIKLYSHYKAIDVDRANELRG
jgi:NADH-quinone oxidoreductase subunit K